MRESGYRSAAIRYGFSAVIILAAYFVRLLLVPLIGVGAPFIMFFFAIILISLVMGLGPALLAVSIAVPLSVTISLQGDYPSAQINYQSLIFALEGLALSLLAWSVVKAKRQAEASRDLAREATVLREQFLAIVSHDLKNPLLAVQLKAEILMRSSHAEKFVFEQAKSIKGLADMMDHLIESLLDATRIDSGRLMIKREPREVGFIVSETMELMRPLAATKGINIKQEVQDSRLNVVCDFERVIQVLSNLVGNAIKFSKASKVVTLRCGRSNGMVRFEVADQGPGIADGEIPKLFDRHWQGASASGRSGLGLGLFIVKNLVEAQHGQIWVQSKRGEGSTFFFTLPIATSAEGATWEDLPRVSNQ